MNGQQRSPLRGSCLCGRITYAIHERLETISHCHCPTCRKAHAAAFASATAVKAESLEFTTGKSLLRYYESSPGKRRYFCPNCGSHIYASTSGGDRYQVYVGTLDSEPGPCLSHHLFTQHRVSWYNGQDAIPEYEADVEEIFEEEQEAAENHNLSKQILAALNAALKRGTTTSLLLLEIDHFILYGDKYGEGNVEEAIVATAASITKNIREADIAALHGDFGFAVLLPYTDAAAAIMIAERIRKIIQSITTLKQQITASIGIASISPDQLHDGNPAALTGALIEHTELALKQAKKEGGNQTRHYNRLS